MHYKARDIENMLQCESRLPNPDAVFQGLAFDSRRIHRAENSLFFALPGKNRNGAHYVADAYKKGVRSFVVSRDFDTLEFADANFFLVDHVLGSLQQLAEIHRSKFTGVLVGITGSNGKTIVKEWLYHLLKNDFSIARSPRSYNSALGVGISLLGIEKWHNLALVEAGISEPGEMEVLQKMIVPSMGIFTHLGSAHDENFSGRIEKAREKLKLFSNCDVLVYPADAAELREEVLKMKLNQPLLKTITWGFHESASFRLLAVQANGNSTDITFIHRSTEHHLNIPFTDNASVENAMTCLCAIAALERWDPEHIKAFSQLEPLENRMVFTEGKNGNYVVNDSYSNDLDSLEVALDFLLRQQPDMPHTVILSDLEQSSPDKDKLYARVAQMLRDKKTSKLLAVGPEISNHNKEFSEIESVFFTNTEALEKSGILDRIAHMAILVKGARSYRLERVSDRLRKQLHKTFLEIDLHALRNNFTYFRNQIAPQVKVMAMVKAFGYGSGSFEAARALQFAGADYLAVAYVDEGIQLRKAGIQVPVMVMNTGIDDLHALLEYDLEPVVFHKEGLQTFAAQGSEIAIHVELDTGMHRLGFDTEGIAAAFGAVPEHVTVKSVFSHLAASEATEHDNFTSGQIEIFAACCEKIEKVLGYKFLKHIANTGGILRFPNSHFDMVRLGIGLYGVDPSGQPNRNLETVISLKTTVSQVKTIAAGDSVGYGRRSIAEHQREIAIVPVGYADGLWRKLGNGNGFALINGKEAPFLGSICMDMAMCDVTGLDCREGDDVEIFGKQLRVEKIAEKCDTIPYEILTGISPRVRREYSSEN
jgi:alanine racemase